MLAEPGGFESGKSRLRRLLGTPAPRRVLGRPGRVGVEQLVGPEHQRREWNIPFQVPGGQPMHAGVNQRRSLGAGSTSTCSGSARTGRCGERWDRASTTRMEHPVPGRPGGRARPRGVGRRSLGPQHLDVFWVGPGRVGVEQLVGDQNINDAKWNTPFEVAGPMLAEAGAVTAVARTPEHLDVFRVGRDGSVWSNWWDQNINDAKWNAPFQVAGPMLAEPGRLRIRQEPAAAVARAAAPGRVLGRAGRVGAVGLVGPERQRRGLERPVRCCPGRQRGTRRGGGRGGP